MRFVFKTLTLNDAFSLLSSVKFRSIFALPPFVELQSLDQKASAKKIFYIEIKNLEEGVDALVPMIISRNRLDLNLAFSPSPPQFIEGNDIMNELWKVMLDSLLNYLKKQYNISAFSMCQRPYDPIFIKERLNGWDMQYTYDIVINLSNDIEKIYYNFDKRHRYALRKATGCSDRELITSECLKKTGYIIQEAEDIDAIREFRSLWTMTLNRMYESFSLPRRLFYKDPLTLEKLYKTFNKLKPYGLIKLFTIYDETGNPGASNIYFVSGEFLDIPTALWSAGASTEKGRKKGFPLLLHWYAIRWFKENGYKRYFLGGYDATNPHSGPSLFKKGFGGLLVSGVIASWYSQPFRLIRRVVSYMTNPFK